MKLKTGAGTVAAEADRIGAMRQAIGDEALLLLDMNAAYDLSDCIEFAHAVEPHRIFWLEMQARGLDTAEIRRADFPLPGSAISRTGRQSR